jgi:Flp pilus assembly pilin Flp
MRQQPTLGEVKRDTERAVRQTLNSPWVGRLARFGYSAKGAVYIVIGVLAAMAALGVGGRLTDSRGALQTIFTQPFGKVLLGLVAVGLVGYALWRFVQAGVDAEHKGAGAKGVVVRTGYFISGLIHAVLAYTAIKLLIGEASSAGGTQGYAGRVLANEWGQWLLTGIGVIVVGVGISQLYRSYSAKFRDKLKLGEMSEKERTWATRAGRLGFVARGVVFAIIGSFVVQAALTYDETKVQGMGGALTTIAGGPFGSIVLPIIALGLIAYGLFMFVEARYRRIPTR